MSIKILSTGVLILVAACAHPHSVASEIDGAPKTVNSTMLSAHDGAANDHFGFSVALSNDTAVIGAFRDDDEEKGENVGSAYVFIRSGNDWTEQAKLTAADGAAGDTFGGAVTVSGETAIVAAMRAAGEEGDAEAGAVYVFTRSDGEWTQHTKLTPDDPAPGVWFGYSIAMDGDTLLIGAAHHNDNGGNSGAAYIFERNGTTWRQQAKITPDDGAAGDVFGISVALSGNTALIGADLVDGANEDSGAAYVFVRDGSSWRQQAKLAADDGGETDIFGVRVALSGDTALIGARRDDDEILGVDSGSAYVFVRTGTAWSQAAKLTAKDGAPSDLFGYNVVLVRDTAVITAPGDDDKGDSSGSAYVFRREGGDWTQREKITAPNAESSDLFGWSITFQDTTMVIGAPTSIFEPPGKAGAAFVFEVEDN